LASYPFKPHYGMVIRQGLCIDCERCIEACNQANAVPSYGYRTQILTQKAPNAIGRKLEFIPALCNHCNTPPCVRGCPTHATYKDTQNGIVMMESEKCIGCKACLLACPYEARYFNHEKGASDKCDFCWESRLSKGEKTTACTGVCPSGARIFGDLSNPNHTVYRLVHQLEEMVWVLRPEAGAEPNVFYMKGTTTRFGIPAIPQLGVM
jgi:protein NrfC